MVAGVPVDCASLLAGGAACRRRSFSLAALLQKRVRELVRGQSKPLFETRERNYIKIASEALKRGLIELVPDEEQTGPSKLEV